MGDRKLHLSKCEYTLREPRETFGDSDFEKVRAAVQEWGRYEGIACETRRTVHGFEITLRLEKDDHEAHCTSLYFYLAGGTFLDLEKKGLWMTHLED